MFDNDNWICFKFFGQIQVLLKLDKGKVTQNVFVSRIWCWPK